MAAERASSRLRNATLGRVLLALLLLDTIYLYQSGRLQQLSARMSAWAGLTGAEPQHGAIRVFFTTTALRYPDTPRQRPSSPLLGAVLADLDAARASLD